MAIELAKNTQSWFLGIKALHKLYYPCGDTWKVMRNGRPKCCASHRIRYEPNQRLVMDACGLLENWCCYLPGVLEYSNYFDFHIAFDMELVTDAGWTVEKLAAILQNMANAINRNKNLVAIGSPYKTEYRDTMPYWCLPALKPLFGMDPQEYPRDIGAPR